MNRFWILIVVLFSVNLMIADSVHAYGALKYVEISRGRNSQRQLDKPGTIEQEYLWNFDKKSYTVLMAIDNQWYNRNRGNKRQKRRGWRNFRLMVQEGTNALQDLVREFNQVMPRTWNVEQKVNFILAFIQSLPYTPDDVMTGHDEFYRYAIETLVEGGGDCEDTSVLFASILSGLGFEVALIWLPGHLGVGVKGNFRGDHFPYGNSSYYYCETTAGGWRLGVLPPSEKGKMTEIMPITPAPVLPKQVIPQANPPNPKPPKRLSPEKTLEKGVILYEQARFNEAIKCLRSALDRLEDPGKRAEAYLYLGFSKRGFGEANDKVRHQFQEAFRHNLHQKLPSRIGKNHPIFAPLFEEVRKESIGELTVTASPQTDIWIGGNGVNRMIGTETVSVKLFKGNYTVKGIYKGESIEKIVTIQPNRHKRCVLEIPVVDGTSPTIRLLTPHDGATFKVNEKITINAKVTDNISVKQVLVHFSPTDKRPLSKERSSDRYTIGIRTGSAGSIWYHLTATDEEKNESRYPKIGKLEITVESPFDETPPVIRLVKPHDGAKFKVNQRITIEATVKDDTSVKWVSLSYAFSQGRRPKPSQYYHKNINKTSSGMYTGYAPPQNKAGYIWYYLTATDGRNKSKSEVRRLEVKTISTPSLLPPIYKGIWAGVSADDASTSDWDGGNTFRLAYLREGKKQPTLGVQLVLSHPDRTNVSAIAQWGPALENSDIAFTFLGGIAEYENFFVTSTAARSTHTTPILGAGLKFYPRDRITIDATSSIKFRSNFDTTSLYHYEVGARFYITRELNLRVGYGKLYLGNRNITTMQVGFGYTF